MFDWLQSHETLLWWLVAASVLTFLATLMLIPWWIVRIPSDYFTSKKRYRAPEARRHPLLRASLLLGKNALGLLFLLIGLSMLVLPGQGLLTILAGILLIDFPGKYRGERWVVTRPSVLRSINGLRHRAGKPPLVLDIKDETAAPN